MWKGFPILKELNHPILKNNFAIVSKVTYITLAGWRGSVQVCRPDATSQAAEHLPKRISVRQGTDRLKAPSDLSRQEDKADLTPESH